MTEGKVLTEVMIFEFPPSIQHLGCKAPLSIQLAHKVK
jgi:hypothetical protein